MRLLFTRPAYVVLAAATIATMLCVLPLSPAEASSLCLVPTGTTTCSPSGVVVAHGIDVSLDVVVSLDPGIELGAYFLDLGWAGSSLGAVSAIDGGFLGACASATPCFTETLLPGELIASFFDDTGIHAATGDGVLATMTFTPLLTGIVDLTFLLAALDDSQLSPILVDGQTLQPQGLRLNVQSATAPTPVPEPATVLLLGSGLLGAVVRKRRSGKVSR